jgi:phosphate-selective porin OprO and OprP
MDCNNRIRTLRIGVLLFTLLFFAPGLRAQQTSDVDRLLELLVKKNVITREEATAFREEVGQERVVQQAQAIADKQLQVAQLKEQPVTASRVARLSGWAQTRYISTAGTKNTFELRRARVQVAGNLADDISYKIQADFVRSPVLLDARVDFMHFQWAKLTIGQFKIPFSQENLISSKDLLTMDRSLVVNTIIPGRDTGSNGRDIGVQVEGSIVRSDGRPLFDYSIGLFNGAGTNTKDNNHRKDPAVRMVAHLTRDLWVGGDYYRGWTGVTQIEKERSEGEFAYTRPNWSLRGEYIRARDGAVRKRGSYTQFAYLFKPQWEGVFKFEDFDANTHAANDEIRTYLLGLNWYLSNWVKFQANYGVGDETARIRLNHTFQTQFQFQF